MTGSSTRARRATFWGWCWGSSPVRAPGSRERQPSGWRGYEGAGCEPGRDRAQGDADGAGAGLRLCRGACAGRGRRAACAGGGSGGGGAVLFGRGSGDRCCTGDRRRDGPSGLWVPV